MARARAASATLARVALICYLMPVILLVFAIGGLAIGAGRIQQMFRMLVESLPAWPPSMRSLAALPSHARKSEFSGGSGIYQKPRSFR
jgi:hypothetical protein